MTETQLRFLRAIADRIDPERMAELHLFPPIKQGGSETGVAVVAAEAVVAAPLVDERHDERHSVVVFSAHYRLVLKGADRGKWEAEITEEADAPLVTVDEVVRGVQRRGGEDAEPERLSGDRVREILATDAIAQPART